MFGWSSKNTASECALIIDIGSGSVGAAIIISDAAEPHPTYLWTHREHVALRDISSTSESLKLVTTALVNVFLEIGSSGQKALYTFDPTRKITTIQASVTAPWSYTVSKTIHFEDEHPFIVNKTLIDEFNRKAETETLKNIKELGLAIQDLDLINNTGIDLRINGYEVNEPNNQQGRTVSLTHVSGLARKSLITALVESLTKVLPKCTLKTHTFIFLYYCLLRDLYPDTNEACLVNVTSEATEVAVIRDGILKHTTHIPYGIFTLTREIAALCKIPKEEAYTYLKGGTSFVETKLSDAQQEELAALLQVYQDKLTELLTDTGDELAIPESIFIHTDALTEAFFVDQITKSSLSATKHDHSIHCITSKFLDENHSGDTAIMLSAEFFHRRTDCNT